MKIQDIIKQRVLFLDGAMGTMIQQFHLDESDFRGDRFTNLPGIQRGNNDLLTLTRPDIIADIHRKYLIAGADIIETNSFNAQRISMADYHCEHLCREINLEAAKIARSLADEFTQLSPEKPRWVAGSVGPTNKTCSMSPDANNPALRTLSFDTLTEAYIEQIEAFIDGGIDVLLIETIFDTLNAKAALYAAEQVMQHNRKVPIMLSATIADKGGRTLSGQSLEAFITSISHYPILSVGLNCSFGATDMAPYIRQLANKVPFYISAYPNAGLPNYLGEYDQTPEEMAEQVSTFINERLVNIVGGCCGTTDAYIAQIVHRAMQSDAFNSPRNPANLNIPSSLHLSGLEDIEIAPSPGFIRIGERCNVSGSRKFLRLIREKQYEEAIEIARSQVRDGAKIIDINLDDGLLDSKEEMTHFLHLLASEPDIASVPFMVDSSNWDVIVAALKCIQGKCIVNSISLKEGEEEFLRRASYIKAMGAAVVVMAFDEQGQADTAQRKIDICQRAYHLLTTKLNLPPSDIIFDPNILAVCTGIPEHDAYALAFIEATEWITQHLKGCHVCGGISNLSFAFRGNNYLREALHTVFLHHATQRGMNLCIVNPKEQTNYNDIPIEFREELDKIILHKPFSVDALLSFAEKHNPKTTLGQENHRDLKQDTPDLSTDKQISYAVVKGESKGLEDYLKKAIDSGMSARSIIEQPLMEGMNIVGELFGQGKMYLPQVVKSARIMKQAVDFLHPHIVAEHKGTNQKAGKILLATVKGDVHDIGKNIVALILSCNNYEIIDLGVMCPSERIVQMAKEEKPDIIGLSGLITPSLEEMTHVAKELEKEKLSIPLIIGGATTSRTHTKLKIAPNYSGPTIWVKDASLMAEVVRQLQQCPDKAKVAQQWMEQPTNDNNSSTPPIALTQARDNKLNLFK